MLARVPLASGTLGGKYCPGMQFPDRDLRSTRGKDALVKDLQVADPIKQTEVPEGMDWPAGPLVGA